MKVHNIDEGSLSKRTLDQIRSDITLRRSQALASIERSERDLRNEILESAASASERMGAWAGYLLEQSGDGPDFETTRSYWDGYRKACVEIADVVRGIIFHGLSASTNTAGRPLVEDAPPTQLPLK